MLPRLNGLFFLAPRFLPVRDADELADCALALVYVHVDGRRRGFPASLSLLLLLSHFFYLTDLRSLISYLLGNKRLQGLDARAALGHRTQRKLTFGMAFGG